MDHGLASLDILDPRLQDRVDDRVHWRYAQRVVLPDEILELQSPDTFEGISLDVLCATALAPEHRLTVILQYGGI